MFLASQSLKRVRSLSIISSSTGSNNIMKTRQALSTSLGVLATLSSQHLCWTASALPFGTRGASSDTTTNEDNAEAVTDAMGEIVRIHLPKGNNNEENDNRNPVVEAFFAAGDTSSSSSNDDVLLFQEIQSQAQNLSSFLTSTRRNFHQRPELMYQEKETSAMIQATLQQLDIPHSTGWAVNTHPTVIPGPGGYGIVADIGTGQAPCVLLRADMDALPIHERTEQVDNFRSQTPDQMHACGHDGHTTMLLGAAAILKGMEESINGTVRLMFQPAEEGGAGAKRMVEEGVMTLQPPPQHAFGLHVWPTLPSGSIAGRPGPLLAAAERFEILIAGTGGHAAMPHLTHDPIVTASAIIMNLQTVVSRTMSPLESGVVSITKMEAGDAFNIIPASALLRGTIRALSTETLMTLRDRVHHIMESTAAVHGCNVTITYSPDYYPPTVNDPELYHTFSKDIAAQISTEGYTRDTEPTMGGEDFSFVAEQVPSTFFLLGQGSGQDPPTNYGLHHPHFALDESVMPQGVELHVNLALRALRRLGQQQQQQQTDDVKAAA
ncbi:IAA-amino acid hydrolase ILR1-like [Seminavis robusta]|uniref:IAA-amino acid hydrolase ILR1-like n=1 Tax=Seminavis robusta TaxID=568900 RepID=A0A9N8HK17_9STRA|nr:IAA-amino acid hydrolase ILR1-like [Seminavis robusta]|eukprot:Sro587_g171260.1 IAA-amino acid hydrolase ILR1-like (550) ;mRNA; f:4483-6258